MTHNSQTLDATDRFGTTISAPPWDNGGSLAPSQRTPDHLTDPVVQERHYQTALRIVEQGEWARAIPLLRALQTAQPTDPELAALLQAATLRAEMENQWGDQVLGRQDSYLPVRWPVAVVALCILGAIFIGGGIYYRQTERANTLLAQETHLRQAAHVALSAGQLREALDLFSQILVANPADADAHQGKRATLRQLQIVADYQLALDHTAAGNYQEARQLLTKLQTLIPGYRDVDKRVAELNTMLGAPRFFADGELAFTKGLWVTAIVNYEQLRRLDGDYEATTTQDHLAAAYVKAGQQMIAFRPTDSMAPEQALAYLQKALQVKPGDAALKNEIQELRAYLEGERLVNQGIYEPAIRALLPIYEKRPTYFGGYVVELLYRAYIGMAEERVRQQSLADALAVYQRAVALGLDQQGLIEQRITALSLALTPTQPTTPPYGQ